MKPRERRQREAGSTEKGQETNDEGRIKMLRDIKPGSETEAQTPKAKEKRLNDRQAQKPQDAETEAQKGGARGSWGSTEVRSPCWVAEHRSAQVLRRAGSPVAAAGRPLLPARTCWGWPRARVPSRATAGLSHLGAGPAQETPTGLQGERREGRRSHGSRGSWACSSSCPPGPHLWGAGRRARTAGWGCQEWVRWQPALCRWWRCPAGG